jgi:hypothetical protein
LAVLLARTIKVCKEQANVGMCLDDLKRFGGAAGLKDGVTFRFQDARRVHTKERLVVDDEH